MPTTSEAQKRLMEAAAHTPGGYGGVPQSVGQEFISKDDERGKLNEKEQREADKDHAQREDMPASAFLEGESRKYPVKVKRGGEWEYDRDLLLAAEREAAMHGHDDLAAKAKRIREHKFDSNEVTGDSRLGEHYAMDRATVRRVDADGRLHVQVTNISKATVNPYMGQEIPGWQGLGLEPDRIYQLLRDPGELAQAAGTFNNIPLLSKHIPVSADEPQKDYVVGATGSNAEFDDPYLKNSLVVWDSSAIAGIESREQYELSCAYRYVPDMTPGTYEGVPYDGVMRQIVGNHVALVEVGRAGPDVVVSDSNPFQENRPMAKKASSKTVAVRAAVRAFMRPLLAADAALDLKSIIGDVSGDVSESDARTLANAIQAKAKLAQDANLNDLHRVIMDAASSEEDDEEDKEKPGASDDEKDSDGPDDKKSAEDEDDEEKDDGKAMDAAISAATAKARAEAEAAAIKRMQAIHKAEKEVAPILGEVAAMDSAEAVYKLALDHLEIDVTDVHPSAYASLVRMHTKNASESKHAHLAQDAAKGRSWWDENFPEATLPGRA